MGSGPLLFRAGKGAFDEIRARGFSAERIGTIAGASGGAKWLVLSQLDRVIIERILPALTGPVHLIGSSIGAWRFACYAQTSPLEALERFESAYLEQSFRLDSHGALRRPRIPGAPPGIYRDGGVIDYHLDLPLGEPDRLTLFPHFFGQLTPGWFDKGLRWRRHNPLHTERTLLICPSPAFIARLPGGKVPDRTDFVRMTPIERVDAWRRVIAACRELADDLVEVLEHDRLPARLEPL